ncbi:hypothetical protein PU683_05190 [Kosakonia cowanii]|uniref:hypothetical protein n=1 Tax=Kosakonia cowanii TaxID=208223 RepID=UPI0023F6EE96|nr:hypothetical protein [Kosakonia cowanii]MDF7758925.1 hypothetical protein [Kosakonia cowanii]
MTSKLEELKERLKKSLENANNILQLKARIEDDISSVLDILKELTSNSIDYKICENEPMVFLFKDCKRLVYIKKKSDESYGSNLILLGFSINESTGYPMQLETDSEFFECKSVDEMKETLAYIIDKKSIEIMKLISEDNSHVPF